MLDIRIADGVAWLTMNRPERRNAMGLEMVEQFEAAVARVQSDDGIRVAVLCGAPPAFCAGSDLKELGKLNLEEMCLLEARKASVLRSLGLVNKPFIASVDGAAMGGGAFFAAGCDIVIASDQARFQCLEVPNGWISPWGLQVLVSRVGPVSARRLSMGYEPTWGPEAHRIGLADYLCASQEIESRTSELAQKVAALPSVSVASNKRFFMPIVQSSAESYDAQLNVMFAQDCSDPAAQETLKRFAG